MKIYFGFTVAGDRSSVSIARRLVELLEGLGHEVLTRHLVSDTAAQMDRSIAPEAVFERDMKWLRQCDIFIAEVSGSSFGLGYETGYFVGLQRQEGGVVLSARRRAAHLFAHHREYPPQLPPGALFRARGDRSAAAHYTGCLTVSRGDFAGARREETAANLAQSRARVRHRRALPLRALEWLLTGRPTS